MKINILSVSLGLLSALIISMTGVGQPCDNGISTNPSNPVNNQFVPMGNSFFPENGTDTHNPFLNGFDWYFGNNTIELFPDQVNWTHFFSSFTNPVNMQHPYGGSMPSQFQYLRPDSVNPTFRDFRWEDGWELLYMNLGYFPDMNPTDAPAAGSYYANHSQSYDPIPSNIPYFVLYNRYRGLLRLFANVWYPVGSNFENIDVTLRFTPLSRLTNKLTGILRHASAYDRALSEPTSITEVHAPRYHAPNYTQWIVADFQIAYDPCSCISQGELEFVFTSFSSLDVDIIGRSIALDVPINANNYTTRNFMNLSNINTNTYEPGTEIYQNLDSMLAVYARQQMAYLEQLEEYNVYNSLQKKLFRFGVRTVVGVLSKGVTEIVFSDSLATILFSDDLSQVNSLIGIPAGIDLGELQDILSDWTKERIAESNNTLLMEVYGPAPSKPKPVAIPVATLEESVYKGTITGTDTTFSSPLVLPGSLPYAYPFGTSLEPNRVPVYNEVLGTVALLNSPSPIAKVDFPSETFVEITLPHQAFSCEKKERWTNHQSVEFRFDEELLFSLNPALDFDMSKTNTAVQIEINVNFNGNPISAEENLYLVDDYSIAESSNLRADLNSENGLYPSRLYRSEWIPLDELNQHVFGWKRSSEFDITRYGIWEWDGIGYTCSPSTFLWDNPNFTPDMLNAEVVIKMKVLHDLYFDQIGSSEEQVNVLNVHSYILYSDEHNVDLLNNDGPWATVNSGYFDLYIPGTITLGNETLTTNHPLVHHVDGDEIYINAQEVIINGPLQVQQGYIVIIQALEQIHIQPGTESEYNPKVHLRIKKDFYYTPVFEYADPTTVTFFCSQNGQYQANTASRPLMERILNEQQTAVALEKSKPAEISTIRLYPNPTSGLLQITSSNAPINQIEVYDLSGRRLYHQAFGNGAGRQVQADLSALSNGVYLVKTTSGGVISTEKLVVGR